METVQWSLLGASFLGVLFPLAGCPREERREIDTSKIVAATKQIQPVRCVIIGRTRITRAMHAHSPVLPGQGRDSYTFRGHLVYSGKRAKVTTRYEPVGLVRCQGACYLLAQGYFSNVKQRFLWYREGKGGDRFQELGVDAVPKALAYVDFTDWDFGRLYKSWYLIELSRTKGVKHALSQFNAYIAKNPRAFYEKKWKRPLNERSTAFSDFLQRVVEKKKERAFFPGLVKVLYSSKSFDSPGAVAEICYSMVNLDERAARKVIVEYHRTVKKEHEKDDGRLRGLVKVIREMKWQGIQKGKGG